MDDVKVGDSIAVNGICLTVTSLDNGAYGGRYATDMRRPIWETQDRRKVNLERALRPVDRMEGILSAGI